MRTRPLVWEPFVASQQPHKRLAGLRFTPDGGLWLQELDVWITPESIDHLPARICRLDMASGAVTAQHSFAPSEIAVWTNALDALWTVPANTPYSWELTTRVVRISLTDGRSETVADLEDPVDLRAGSCTPDGRRLAMAGDCGVWRLDLVQAEALAPLHVGGTCLEYSGDGRWLAVGGRGGMTVFCDETEVARWPNPAVALAWAPNGRLVWVDGERLYVARVGTAVSTLSWSGGAMLALSPDGRRALLGADHGAWALCDLDAATIIHSGPGGVGAIRSVAWSDDGRCWALGGDQGRISIWEA